MKESSLGEPEKDSRVLSSQVEQEKNSIHNEKSDVEQDKSTLRQVLFRLAL